MGYVYYGNYAAYFEVARVEALRNLGFSYRKLEDEGILLPVLSYSVKYIKPAYYDDELIIKVTIKDLPMARIRFDYETYNSKDELINTADTTLVFINRETNKPCAAPQDFISALKKYF
jgi:acyl-CoA thioester hydrolase